MNSKNDNRATAQDNAQGATKTRNYRPALSIYHANGKGTGSAVRFEVVPAASGRDGAVFMTLAQQKSVASGSREHGNRQHATFDWQNRVTVKLNFDDLCRMIPVLRGITPGIAEDGKGLYHDSRSAVSTICLAFQTEPVRGHALDVSCRPKTGGGQPTRVRILFNAAEAFGLAVVLEQALGLVAFGIPRNYPSGAAAQVADNAGGDDGFED